MSAVIPGGAIPFVAATIFFALLLALRVLG